MPSNLPSSPKPRWLRAPIGGGERYRRVKSTLGALRLRTVCEGASCPNAGECWSAGTATFLLMGELCTRSCRFCDVPSAARPPPLDPEEPGRVAAAVAELGLDYVVLTSVDRDDLPDGGAAHFAEAIRRVRGLGGDPGPGVEALIPDFGGVSELVRTVARAGPDVIGQNLETVRRLTPAVRDARAGYDRTLELLTLLKHEFPGILTKSSLLLGLGERAEEVSQAMIDLRGAGVELLTLGQYLQPSPRQLPVSEWVAPERFAELEAEGRSKGFRFVASGPLVRSSYRAGEQFVRRGAGALALAAALVLGGCAGRPLPPTPSDPRAFAAEPWTSPLQRDHPLVGHALAVREERWVGLDEISAALAGAEFIYLGETHDNEDHHRLQALFLRAALTGGRRPALAFEMLDTAQAGAIATAETPEAIAEATQWKKSGWPDFAFYRPLFEIGLAARLEIVAANLPRSVAREAVRKGLEPLPADVRQWMERAGDPSARELEIWAKEMEENHCQEVPRELLTGLVRAQRARDVQLALRVAAAAEGRGAVLITGDGHARTDRGVPAWVERMRPGRRSVSIGLIELDGELRWPRQYAEPYGAGRFPFDFVVFTPRAAREDPCEELRRRNRERAGGKP